MQFLFPSFLWALLALAIPIIIHLYSFRRYRKVFFTNVRFLKEVKEETSSRQKLKNLLVLISRCLSVAALVFAFAQPFIPQKDKVVQGERAVSVYIDNSFSMNALSQDIPLVDKAKQRAREIVEGYAPDDQFQIITNDFEGRHQRLVSKEDALGLIDEIKPSPSSRMFTQILQRQKQALNLGKAPNKVSYILSDFQKNITNVESYKDSTIQVNLVPLQAVQEKNIAIDSAWFEAPVQMLNQISQVVVKVRNYSTTPAENVRVTLKHNGQEKPVGTFNIPAKSVATDTVNITVLNTGWHEATLTLSDYPVQFDDSYNFSFYVAEKVNILTLNDNIPNRYLSATFGSSSYFSVTEQNSRNIDYSKLSQYQLIVLNETTNISTGLASELGNYAKNGGNVLLFPNGNSNAKAYKPLLDAFSANEFVGFDISERQVASINTDEFIFNNVFVNKNENLKLPISKGNFKIGNISSKGGENLMTYRDGTPFLQKYSLEKGNLYVCAAPLDERFSNLSKSGEIFVPMLYKMAIATAKSPQIAYTIGKDEFIEAESRVSAGESTYKIKGKNEEFIPDQKTISSKVILGVGENIKDADFYNLYINPKEIINKFAFNYDRKESDLQYFTKDDLTKFSSPSLNVIDANDKTNFTALVGERSQGVPLWRWFIIFALIALAIEQLLLRFFK